MKALLSIFTVILPFCSPAQKVVVAAAKQNVVYVGLPNPIDVAVEGYKCSDLNVITSSGKLEPAADKCSYQLHITKAEKVLITVSDKRSGKQLGQMEFRAKYIPDPIVTVGGKQGGPISKSRLMVQQGIAVIMPGFDFDGGFRVTSFSAMIASAKETTYEEKIAGPLFSSNLKKAFEDLAVGDKVFFEDIRAKGPDGQIRLLMPLQFTITQ